MTHHIEPPQGRRVIVQEIWGINPPGHPASKAELLSPDELAMLIFRRDLYRKKLQHRYDIKLFRERFHRDMAVFEAQLAHLREVEAQRQRTIQRRFDPAQPRDAYGRWTDGGGGGGKVLDIGTLHPDPQDGAGGAAPREPEPTRVAQATGTLSDVAQPLLGDRSSPGEATAALPAVAAGAISVAVAALRAVGPAIARALVDGLFNQKTPDEKPAGIGHNSGETEPLDPAPTPPQQQPPNPLPGAVGAAAALSQQGPKVPATPSGFTTLAEESKFGGHGYANHVNTTIAEAERWVLKRANSRRYGIRGTQRRGVFNSAAEADRLIADVLAAHPDVVRQVSSGALNQAELMMQFSKPTGIEASAKGPSSVAAISLTYGVKLVLRHLHGNSRGSYILTAFPANKTP